MSAELVRVSADGWGFAEGTGHRPFVPWGCNYYDPFTGWAPRLWEQFDPGRVTDHFAQMQSIGVNTVRVFTTLMAALETAEKLNTAGLEKITRMLAIAESHGIHVILSGPGTWEGSPSWWHAPSPLDCFVKPDLLKAQAFAWKGLASALAGHPGLFSWELYNEPCVPWKASPALGEAWTTWRSRNAPNGSSDVPSPQGPLFLDWSWDLQRFRDDLAVDYVRTMTDAIRAVDGTHLVTIGLHQKSAPFDWYPPDPWAGFNAHRLAPMLDYISVHYYPHHVFHPNIYRDPFETEEGMVETLIHGRAVARYLHVPGMPVLMEECGWYGGGPVFFADREQRSLSEEQQTEWCTRLVDSTRGDVTGWLFWPYRDTPSSLDPSRRSGLFDEAGRLKDWGRAFARLAPEVTGSPRPRQAGTVVMPAPLRDLTTDPQKVKTFRTAYLAAFKAGKVVDFPLS
jgi:hypothetical protein